MSESEITTGGIEEEGLKIGGEDLKRRYDVSIRPLFEKYGKSKVEMMELPGQKKRLPPLPAN
jgi:hypothetical protein